MIQLVDGQNLLRKKFSLTSFIAGFKLAWGIAKELEADGLYKEEQRACKAAEQEVTPRSKETG